MKHTAGVCWIHKVCFLSRTLCCRRVPLSVYQGKVRRCRLRAKFTITTNPCIITVDLAITANFCEQNTSLMDSTVQSRVTCCLPTLPMAIHCPESTSSRTIRVSQDCAVNKSSCFAGAECMTSLLDCASRPSLPASCQHQPQPCCSCALILDFWRSRCLQPL
jgi:hypothetical protein